MGLVQRGSYWYGDGQADITAELLRYSIVNGYPAVHFADAVCRCGGRRFGLRLDDTEGAAVRDCPACGEGHPVGDSDEYLEDADLEACECPCGQGTFEITVGVSLYDGGDDVRWLHVGCRCTACGLTACYGDWKNEYDGYEELLSRV